MKTTNKTKVLLGVLIFLCAGLNTANTEVESEEPLQLLVVGSKGNEAVVSAIGVSGISPGEVSIKLRDEEGNIINSEPLGISIDFNNNLLVSFSDRKIRMYNSCGEIQKIDGVNWYWEVFNRPDGLDYDGSGLVYCSSSNNRIYRITPNGVETDLGVVKRKLSIDGVVPDPGTFYTTQEYTGYNPTGISQNYLCSGGLSKISKRDLSIGTNFIQTIPAGTPIWTNEQDTPIPCLGIVETVDYSVPGGIATYLSCADGSIYKVRFVDKTVAETGMATITGAEKIDYLDGSPTVYQLGVYYDNTSGRRARFYSEYGTLRPYFKVIPPLIFTEVFVLYRGQFINYQNTPPPTDPRGSYYSPSPYPQGPVTYSVCSFNENWNAEQRYYGPILDNILWSYPYDGTIAINQWVPGSIIRVADITGEIPTTTFYVAGRYDNEGQVFPVFQGSGTEAVYHYQRPERVNWLFLTDDGSLEVLDQFTTSIPVPQGLAMGRLQIVDVDIDSDNNNGINSPDRSDTEDRIEEAQPGKFMTVNHNDDNGNSIPDYADETVSEEGNIVPLVVEVIPQLDWTKVELIFSYSGEPTLPNFTPRDIGNDFKDYTDAKKGTMRIWNISSPGEARTYDKYIQPGREYSAMELGFNGEKTFYVEGINPADTKIEIILNYGGQSCKDIVNVSIVEPNLGVNNSNDSTTLRPGIPDVNFDIDDDDEKSDEIVEDQKDGFNFWWSRDKGDNISREGIVDISPLSIHVPQSLYDAGFKFYLKINDGQLYIYPGVSQSDNRREYLQDVVIAERQREQTGLLLIPGNLQQIIVINYGMNEFVFKGIGSGTKTLTLSLLVEEPNTSNRVVADSVKLTFRRTRDYWLFLSTRGTPNIPFTYPTEEHPGSQGTLQINIYPGPGRISGPRDPEKKKHLVMLHGYNVTQEQAEDNFGEVYRRLFWIGFRGNFIGLTWEGDEGGFARITWFDSDVQNVFQTSPSLQRFLMERQGFWGISASDIDIMAHSLGNLVMWDALRLHRRLGTGQVVRNVISFESATWPEAYEQEGPKTYIYPSDPITYSIDELKQHSWAFWFQQAGFETKGAISGAIYHSYLPDDYALRAMRANDFSQRGRPPLIKGWHYYRDRLQRSPIEYRAPEGVNNFYDVIPTLMLQESRRLLFPSRYIEEDLNLPVGTMPSPMAEEKNNYLATNGGWRPKEHGDFLDVQGSKMWFPIIYKWYNEFLGDKNGDQVGRIPIGEE